MRVIRVMLAEDHRVVREGLHALLEAEPEFEIVAEVADGFSAVQAAQEYDPDVIVMDVGLPGLTGVDASDRITRCLSNVKIVILSMHNDGPTVERAIKAGARGYVLKGDGIAALKDAVREVAKGGFYLSSGVSEYALGDASAGTKLALTPREREILKLVAEGYTGRQIAGLLNISAKTVENHRGRMMEKLGIHSTAGLVRYALKAGLTE